MSIAPAASPPGRVLVTDGEFKHTLGIVRALADRGHEVHVLARSRRAPAVHSRAVRAWHAAPGSGAALDQRLLEVAAALAPVSVIPVGSSAMAAADRLRDRWPKGVGIAIPPRAAFATAQHKERTAQLARSLGIDVPREQGVRTVAEARAAWRALGAPLVLKSSREEGRKAVRYVRSEGDLDRAFEEVLAIAAEGEGAESGEPLVLAQEYVAGDGFGFSALYWNGRRRRSFMHRRVREWPPTGGTSAAAESVPECAPLERAGAALLDALAWHGVAMVEFKGDPAKRLVLIEINAKFWGSHDVSLAAGVCFPCDLVAMLEGREPSPQAAVRAVRFSWPLGGDLWYGLARPAALPRVLWDAISPAVAHSWRWSDLGPHVREIAQWARSTPGAFRELKELA
jgi:predicted ATP-grasp superfamily ATP-dependent carboligase